MLKATEIETAAVGRSASLDDPKQEAGRMEIEHGHDALVALDRAWPHIISETRQVLAGELHYQAMIYHCLRAQGGVPLRQLGMNVKQWITELSSDLFQSFDARKAQAWRGGFEPIPDVVIFGPEVAGNWQRRSHKSTLQHMKMAIEVKASERKDSRLGLKEIALDIQKLAAHRQEVQRLGGDFAPVMMIIDVAEGSAERMTPSTLETCRALSGELSVGFYYAGRDMEMAEKPKWPELGPSRFVYHTGDLVALPEE